MARAVFLEEVRMVRAAFRKEARMARAVFPEGSMAKVASLEGLTVRVTFQEEVRMARAAFPEGVRKVKAVSRVAVQAVWLCLTTPPTQTDRNPYLPAI